MQEHIKKKEMKDWFSPGFEMQVHTKETSTTDLNRESLIDFDNNVLETFGENTHKSVKNLEDDDIVDGNCKCNGC